MPETDRCLFGLLGVIGLGGASVDLVLMNEIVIDIWGSPDPQSQSDPVGLDFLTTSTAKSVPPIFSFCTSFVQSASIMTTIIY
jgi:hypothetical protein